MTSIRPEYARFLIDHYQITYVHLVLLDQHSGP